MSSRHRLAHHLVATIASAGYLCSNKGGCCRSRSAITPPSDRTWGSNGRRWCVKSTQSNSTGASQVECLKPVCQVVQSRSVWLIRNLCRVDTRQWPPVASHHDRAGPSYVDRAANFPRTAPYVNLVSSRHSKRLLFPATRVTSTDYRNGQVSAMRYCFTASALRVSTRHTLLPPTSDLFRAKRCVPGAPRHQSNARHEIPSCVDSTHSVRPANLKRTSAYREQSQDLRQTRYKANQQGFYNLCRLDTAAASGMIAASVPLPKPVPETRTTHWAVSARHTSALSLPRGYQLSLRSRLRRGI